MSWHSKVIWAEGMLLQQQHFQQHDRFLRAQMEARVTPFPWGYGFSQLQIDEAQLALGKIALLACRAILPDGTPLNLPAEDDLPLPLDVPADARNVMVMLALPTQRAGTLEVSNSSEDNDYARYRSVDLSVQDSNGLEGTSLLQVGKLRLKLALAHDVQNAYTSLGVARIIERRSNNQVMLDGDYYPPCLDCRAVPKLGGFIDELVGLLHQRGDVLAARLAQPGAGGVAEISDFMLLQLINRFEPLLLHYAAETSLHPHTFYHTLLQLSGELAVYGRADKRPLRYPDYRQDNLRDSFAPLIQELRQSLSLVLENNAQLIALEEIKAGVWRALLTDPELLKSASFVLAVNAQIPPETLRTQFPRQTKVGAIEKLRDIVNLQLSGIPLNPLPVAPRQLPYHAGYLYFELDKNSDYWEHLTTSAGFGIQIAGELPGLQMQFWAITGK